MLKMDCYLKMVKKLLRKRLKKNQARRQVRLLLQKKQNNLLLLHHPSASPAPSASSSDKFQFPSVPQGLTIKDGKTLAAVAIEATAKMSLEGKDSPNQTIGKGVATIPEGANLQVTAISTDGVAEVSYEGQTVYVLTSGLS